MKLEVTPKFYARAEKIWAPVAAEWSAKLSREFSSEELERISGFEAKAVPPHKWSYIGRDLETFREFYKGTRPELFQPRTR